MLEKIKQFVDGLFKVSASPNTPKHLQNVLDALLKLKPDADESMQIAAYAHDVERAYVQVDFKDKDFNEPGYLARHQEAGAKIICDFLKKENYNQEGINRVYNMIRHHEDGGDDDESNIIMNADSLGYLFSPGHLKAEHINNLGKEKVRDKIDYMYNRMATEKAKELAKPYYDKAVEALENYPAT